MTNGPATERTSAGIQYVIPGAERRPRPRATRYAMDGDQLVLPGAERIGTGELLRRRMLEGIMPRRGQRAVDTTPLLRVEPRRSTESPSS